jgi:osmotically-inducible protein OsmY
MTKQTSILIATAFTSLLMGCAHQSPVNNAGGNFSDPDDLTASSSSTPRVSGTTTATAPGGGLATLTITNSQASADGSAADPAERELLDKVRRLLAEEKGLVPHPSQVTVTLQPNENGTVVLSGKVPNGLIRKRVVDRVASLPGVTRVEDRIEVGLPDDPGTAKPADIVPQNK